MRKERLWVICLLALGMSAAAARAAAAVPATVPAKLARAEEFTSKIKPLLQRYCYECHGDGSTAGDLDLDPFQSHADVMKAQATWQKIIRYARTHVMPPPEAEVQPTQDQRDELVALFTRQLFDPNNPDPGRVTIRRLNRSEYRNTIRDLLGVSFDPTLDFPQDDTGYGFDNIADVLTLPPMLMEKYLAAAEEILEEAIPADRAERIERRVNATDARASFRNRTERTRRGGWVALSSTDEDALSITNEAPAPAEYIVRVLARAKSPSPLTMSIMLGDVVAREIEVDAAGEDGQWYEARLGAPAGRQQFRVALRRLRGIQHDAHVSDGRVGREQPGELLVKAILLTGPVNGAVRRISGDRLETTGPAAGRNGPGAALHKTGDAIVAAIDAPTGGKYVLRVQAYAEHAGDEHARLELLLDDQPLQTFEIAAPAEVKSSPATKDLPPRARRAVPHVYEVETELKAGQRKIAARFVNNFKEPEHADPNRRDRNIYVQHVEVVELDAPALSPPMTAPVRQLFTKHAPDIDRAGAAEARAMLREFVRRAWRRPPSDGDLDRVLKVFTFAREHGEGFNASVRHAMKAVLVSSRFLFRGTTQPAADEQMPHPVDEFELASRLSYFLWSSMPDDELLGLAERGALRENLDAQVKRMLASDKAQALVENFAGQWLQFRNLDAAHPDRKMFAKQYDDGMRDAMKQETRLFFQAILREDRPLIDVLTADYTFVNQRLAEHYGIDGVTGDAFRRVSLKETPRRGVLTHGSVLVLTSNPTRTSPVKRGKWVLQNLLGTEPPPPPPDVPPLEKDDQPLTGTLRQQLEKHREDVACSSCHAPMDPIGFGLENFDAVGRWRDKDGKLPIDPSSEFVNGDEFSGAVELVELLARTRRNDFFRAVTENALTFALGRGVEPFDQPAVDQIVDALRAGDGRFSTLITGIVRSVPFQMRRGGDDPSRQTVLSAEVSHER